MPNEYQLNASTCCPWCHTNVIIAVAVTVCNEVTTGWGSGMSACCIASPAFHQCPQWIINTLR